MESEKTYGNDKLEFRQIVLKHIQRILEISSSELRDKTIVRNHGNYSETIENEDTRQSYMQAIENLAYILMPYFDDEVLVVYEKSERIINAFGYEVKRILKKTYERIKEETGKEDLGNAFIIEMKLKYAKKLLKPSATIKELTGGSSLIGRKRIFSIKIPSMARRQTVPKRINQ